MVVVHAWPAGDVRCSHCTRACVRPACCLAARSTFTAGRRGVELLLDAQAARSYYSGDDRFASVMCKSPVMLCAEQQSRQLACIGLRFLRQVLHCQARWLRK